MLLAIIALGVLIGVVTTGLYIITRWGMNIAMKDIVARLQAGETIVSQESVPEAWVAQYRRRIEAMRKAGKSEEEIERVGLHARDRCLRQIDDLIKFYEKANIVDSSETRDILIGALQEQRKRWLTLGWQALVWPPRQSKED